MSAIVVEEKYMVSHSRTGVQKVTSECNMLCEFIISETKRAQ